MCYDHSPEAATQPGTRVLEVLRDGPLDRAEYRLQHERSVEANRREVEVRSDGRLRYVHIPGMNGPTYRTTFEEVMGRHFHKEGLVIDTRSNGGGDVMADLEMFFSGRYFFESTTDTRSPGFEPSFRWSEPWRSCWNWWRGEGDRSHRIP
jgi:hypothetical protein